MELDNWVLVVGGIVAGIVTATGAVAGLYHKATGRYSWNDGRALLKRFFANNEKTCIAILLPLHPHLSETIKKDVSDQINGFGDFIRGHPELAKNYYFKFIDHKYAIGDDIIDDDKISNELRDVIIEELENGTRYFMCTMSQIAVPLSNEFKKIVDKVGKDDKAVLLCTVTSSPQVKCEDNSVYRFYINTDTEVKLLFDEARKRKFNKIAYIVNRSFYGEDALKEFKKLWGKENIEGIKIDSRKKISISNEIKKHIDLFSNSDGIFIAHYGSDLIAIVETFHKLGINNSTILGTSTFSPWTFLSEYPSYKDDYLEVIKWITCVPKTDSLYDKNVVRDFTYYSLCRFLGTIKNFQNDNGESSFHKAWQRTAKSIVDDYEYIIETAKNDSNDPLIEMEIRNS
ncbi:MAG: amino acid ABC transporter substrate-binding protein [Bacteroidetes bacterium]|nr:amino acid ABC transporter substrate-binding protein [Bacteroidota bacterium]